MNRRTFWVSIILGLMAYLVMPMPGASAPLSQRIAKKRAQIAKHEKKEGVLTTTISGYSNRIRGLQGEIGAAQKRLHVVERDLDAKREELIQVRDKLEVARDRLERLRRDLRTARSALANRIVEMYKSDRPDALTVVLEADGFTDLLERTDFLERISEQDQEIAARVRALRDRAKRQADELGRLERQAQAAAATVQRRRDDIASTRDRLVSARGDLRDARNSRRTVLASVRHEKHEDEEDLQAMEAQQARIRGQLAGAGQRAFAGPIKRGSGRLIWPVNGSFTSPFGQRWGRLHAGIDIAAPTGTPIRAADSGRVVLAGFMGGYGNYTCVQHTGSLSTCYGHQSRLGTSNGAGVRQGQVIGYVGNTGNSTGPHLHFETRVNGSPVDPMGYL